MGGAGSVHGEGGVNTEGAGFTGATADLLVEGEAEISALACDEIFEAAKSSFILMCKKKGLTESQTTAAFSQIMNSRHETLGLDKLEARRVARRASKAAKAAKVPALPKTQVGDKALLLMGDQELEDVNRDLLPESSKSTVNHKAVAMMGDNKVIQNDKAAAQFGSLMKPEAVAAQRKAESSEEKERELAKKQKSKRLLSATLASDMHTGASPKTQVGNKVLEMMGDDKLDEVNREVLPEQVRVNQKAVAMMGDNKVITDEKAKKKFGSFMHTEDVVAQRKAEEKEERGKEEQARANIEAVLKEKNVVKSGTDSPRTQVCDKAVDMMGDDTLSELNKVLLPEQAKVNHKALKTMGDNTVIQSEKAKRQFGSFMHQDQIKKQQVAEAAEARSEARKNKGKSP